MDHLLAGSMSSGDPITALRMGVGLKIDVTTKAD